MDVNGFLRFENVILLSLLLLDLLFFLLPDGNALKTLYVFLFMVIVPGMAVVTCRKARTDVIELLVMSVALSISVAVVLFEFVTYIFIIDAVWVIIIYNILILGLYARSFLRNPEVTVTRLPRKTIKLFLVCLLLVSSLPIFYAFNPYLTFVSDGWKNLSVVNELTGLEVPPSDPRFEGAPLGYPWGYHLMVALQVIIAGTNAVLAYNMFSAFSMVLLFLSTTYLARTFFGRDDVSILSGLFTTSMTGLGWVLLGIDFLGNNLANTHELIAFVSRYSNAFLTTTPFGPMTPYGMSLMAMSVAFFWQYVNGGDRNRLLFGALATGSLFIIEVVPVLAVAMAVLFMLIIKAYASRLNPRTIVPFLLIGLSVLPFYLLFTAVYPLGSPSGGLAISLVTHNGPLELLKIYGIPLLLSLAGLYFAFVKRKREYALMAMLLVAFYLVHNHVDYGSLPIEYRFKYYFLIPVGFFSSYALVNILARIRRAGPRTLVLFIVLMASFMSTYAGIFIYSVSTRDIATDTMEAAEWLKYNTPEDSVILTEPYHYHTYVSAFGARHLFLGAYSSVSGYSRIFGIEQDPAERLEVSLEIFNSTDGPQAASIVGEQGIDYVFLGHMEFLEFNVTQLSKFLDAGFGIAYSRDEALILGYGIPGEPLVETASTALGEAEDKAGSGDDLDKAGEAFDSGDYGDSLIYSKKAMAGFSDDVLASRESSIRSYMSDPSGLLGGFLLGLAYFSIIILIVSMGLKDLCKKENR